MNREVLEAQWVHAKEFLKEKWPNLTDEDIRQINGHIDVLIAKLQQRYGFTKEQAENEINKASFERSLRPSIAADKPYTRAEERYKTEAKREAAKDDSGFLKWLLGLAIALLLLSLYFNMPKSTEPTPTATPKVTQESVVTSTLSDQNLVQSIRQALFSNSAWAADLQNIRISASNGVVTIGGSVATSQERDAIGNMIQNYSGVNRVVNQLTVRQ